MSTAKSTTKMSGAEQANKGIDKRVAQLFMRQFWLFRTIVGCENKDFYEREINWKQTAQKNRFHKTKVGSGSKFRLRFPVDMLKNRNCFVFLVIFLRFPGFVTIFARKIIQPDSVLTDPAVMKFIIYEGQPLTLLNSIVIFESHCYFSISIKTKITHES